MIQSAFRSSQWFRQRNSRRKKERLRKGGVDLHRGKQAMKTKRKNGEKGVAKETDNQAHIVRKPSWEGRGGTCRNLQIILNLKSKMLYKGT